MIQSGEGEKKTRFSGPDVDDIMNAANDRQFFKG